LAIGRQRGWQRDPRIGWLAVACFGAAVVFAGMAVFLASPAAHPIDAALSAAVRMLRNPALTRLAIATTALGGFFPVAIVTALTTVWLMLRHHRSSAVFMMFAVAPGWLVSSVLKTIVARPRPQSVAIVDLPIDFSLPSGHAVAAALCYGAVAIVVALNVRSLGWRIGVIGACTLVILGVGFSRVYLGVHWVGDVIAAWLFAAAWLSGCTISLLGSVTERVRFVPGVESTE
jgi:undecaprenyl-diphosphatase